MAKDDDTHMQPPAGEAPTPPTAPAGEAVAPLPPVEAAPEPVAEPLPLAPSAPARRSWEEWATEKGVPFWAASAACHGRAWPIGQEVTEDEFNAAVKHATESRIG